MGKVIWTLTGNEKIEIQNLYEKKLALENLINVIDPLNEIIYNKLITDYGKIMRLFQKWWSDTSQKYNWESGINWAIDFETNDVIVE